VDSLKKYDRYAGLLYGAFLFLGMSIGMIFGSPGVGVLVGIGLGLLANAIIAMRYKDKE
jgi:uncharacterized membrane protein